MTDARCPRCGRPGPARQPCIEAICASRGVHHLPPAFARAPVDDPIVGRMLDAWLILDRLGEGGMGAVYLAEQQPLGLRAALKLVLAGGDQQARGERFLREASALARLSHPNIVRLMAYGVDRGRPYLVMELVRDGQTLRDLMPRLDMAARRRVLVQLTHALEAAHAEAVVHRDLKPDNIMLQPVAGEPHFVRVVDFGLAKLTDEGAHSRVVAGSPRYMAPEQVTLRAIGPWTDIYATGVLACELLTGAKPFPRGDMRSVALKKADPTYDPLSELAVSVAPGLAAFLRRAMACDPAARFPDAAAMRAALPALDDLEPELARTVTLTPGGPQSAAAAPGRRWARWIAAGVAGLGGVAAVALAGAGPESIAAADARVSVAEPPADAALAAGPAADAMPDAADDAIADATSAPPDHAIGDATTDAIADAMPSPDATPTRARPRPPPGRRARSDERAPSAGPPAPADGAGSKTASDIGGLKMDHKWTKEKAR